MIHPHTRLVAVNAEIGMGVFATQDIPAGTLVYVQDPLEAEVGPDQYAELSPILRQALDRFAYIDPHGNRVLSWDLAKHVNHCCECNTMSTGYGFEIALRDIVCGEEITDEYGLFNLQTEMPLSCGCRNCRGVLRPDDVLRYHAEWDARVREALGRVLAVPQLLWPLVSPAVQENVIDYLNGCAPYRSVLELRWVSGNTDQSVEAAAGRNFLSPDQTYGNVTGLAPAAGWSEPRQYL